MWWVVNPRPFCFNPGKDPVPIEQEAGWAPGMVWMGTENLAPIEIQSPNCPGRGESLYWIHYTGLIILTRLLEIAPVLRKIIETV